MKIGFWEIIVILAVALIVIGPDKLPEYMKSFGKSLNALKKATSEINDELQEDVIKPLNEAAAPLKEAMEPVQETVNILNQDVKTTVKKAVEKKETPVKKDTWICPDCGKEAEGNFCSNCGKQRNEERSEEKTEETL